MENRHNGYGDDQSQDNWQNADNENQWLDADASEDAEELNASDADYDSETDNSLYAAGGDDDEDEMDDDMEDDYDEGSTDDDSGDWGNVDPQSGSYDPDMDPTAPGSAV